MKRNSSERRKKEEKQINKQKNPTYTKRNKT